MKKAIWRVERGRFCPQCAEELDFMTGGEYVMRCDGQVREAVCDRCGAGTVTSAYRYTMSRGGLLRRGMLEGEEIGK